MSENTLRNLDIYVPNFDHTLVQKLENMQPEERELIPNQLKFKIFKNGKASVEKMNFTEKMYLLSVCFKETIIIATMAEDGGLGVNEFKKVFDAQKGKIKNSELLEDDNIKTLFVQSDKELMRAWQYLNHVKCSEIFNLVKGSHPNNISKKEAKFNAYNRNLANLMRLFTHYESNKKNVIINFKLSVPKLYALLYFFEGEKFGKDFYNYAFRHSYTSNKGDLSAALTDLFRDGYLTRRGNRQQLKYSITSKGIELVTRVMNKLIYNY